MAIKFLISTRHWGADGQNCEVKFSISTRLVSAVVSILGTTFPSLSPPAPCTLPTPRKNGGTRDGGKYHIQEDTRVTFVCSSRHDYFNPALGTGSTFLSPLSVHICNIKTTGARRTELSAFPGCVAKIPALWDRKGRVSTRGVAPK